MRPATGKTYHNCPVRCGLCLTMPWKEWKKFDRRTARRKNKAELERVAELVYARR